MRVRVDLYLRACHDASDEDGGNSEHGEGADDRDVLLCLNVEEHRN